MSNSSVFASMADAIERDWRSIARPEQIMPDGDGWTVWAYSPVAAPEKRARAPRLSANGSRPAYAGALPSSRRRQATAAMSWSRAKAGCSRFAQLGTFQPMSHQGGA